MPEAIRQGGAGDEEAYCAELVRRYDPDRFVTALFAPASRRAGLHALYAFNHEIAKTRESAREPLIGHMRLQWWHEAIEAVAAGAAPAQHPVALALGHAVTRYGLDPAPFLRLIEARETDLEEEQPADLAALLGYAEATAGELMALAAATLGADARPAALVLGTGWGLLGLVRAIRFQAAAGMLRVPADLAARHQVSRDDLLTPKSHEGVRGAVRELAVVARERLLTPDAGAFGRAGRSLLGFRALGRAYLGRLERARYDPADPRFAAPLAMPAWRVALGRIAGR